MTLKTIGGSRPAVSREPTRHVYSLSQLRYVLSKLHSYSCSLELGYVHKLYGEMPDTKNQCKKLPTRRKDWKRILQTNANSPNLWSLKVGLLYVASERSSKTKVGKQEKGKFRPEQSTRELVGVKWVARLGSDLYTAKVIMTSIPTLRVPMGKT